MSVGTGSEGNPRDGDLLTIDVEIRDDRVAITRMDIRGCEALRRSIRALSKMAYGRSPEAAARIAPRELIDRVGLVPDEERCALTAIAALRAALVDAHVRSLA